MIPAVSTLLSFALIALFIYAFHVLTEIDRKKPTRFRIVSVSQEGAETYYRVESTRFGLIWFQVWETSTDDDQVSGCRKFSSPNDALNLVNERIAARRPEMLKTPQTKVIGEYKVMG